MTEMRASLIVEADGSAAVSETQRVSGGLDTVSGAADKTAASFQKVATQSRAAERMQERLNATFNGFGAASRSARESAGAFEEAYRAQAAYRALEESIDPLIRAERELAAAQKVVNTAVSSGVASQEEAARSLQILKGRYDAVAAAQGRVGGTSGAMRGTIQNASFQIADAAVQLQAGTAASIVFAQQAPQLLGSMGMMGAVMGAVVAVGAPLVTMLLNAGDATQTFDERLGQLEGSLQSVSSHLEILRDQNLSLTFGNMSDDIRAMTEDLLALDRAAELETLQNTLDQLFSQNIDPTLLQRARQNFTAGLAMAGGGYQSGAYLAGQDLEQQNFQVLTGGRGPDFEEFSNRRQSLLDMAKAGEIEAVTAEVRSLINDFADGGPISDMNSTLLVMLRTLGEAVVGTAQLEAAYNGTALGRRLDQEAAKLTATFQRQSELAAAVVQFGENSAEVEAVRTRHAREGLQVRLREMGFLEDSAREQAVLADFDAAQADLARQRDAERAQSVRDTLAGLSNELAVSQAIGTHGEHSVEVERLRTDQARATLRVRLEELGATEDQIRLAEDLLDQSRAAARQAQIDRAERQAGQDLDAMRRQADLSRAILQYGRESLEVKRLQIAAARAEYEQSLLTRQVTEDTRQALLDRWDQTYGLAGPDPFGALASARAILDTQARSVAQLQLEQSLIGQTEETRRRVLALYEAELQIRRAGIDAESELAAQIRQGAEAASERASEVARQVDAWNSVRSAAEETIDGIVDAALDADLPGVFESIAEDIQGILAELAITNPLTNALLDSGLPTLGDVGGLNGVWTRLTGGVPAIDPSSVAAQAAARSVATMQVTAASVVIGGSGVSQYLSTRGTLDAANTDLPSGPVARQIWDFFRAKGLAPHQVAAIVGNAAGESSFNPHAVGDNGTSFGLFQHHAGRGAGLLSAVGGMSGLGNVEAQLEYVWRELLTSENGVLNRLLASANVEEATSIWMRGFERPSEASMASSWSTRLGSAEAALARFGTTAGDATSTLGSLGLGFDTFGAALAQAAQGFAGGGVQGGLTGFLGTFGAALAGGLGLPGFDGGGPTGGSDPSRVAGLVHEKEFVFDAASTRRIGVANLEAIRRGRMPGYSGGGYVSHASAYSFLAPGSAANNAAPIDARPIITVQNNSSTQIRENIEETTGPRGQRQYKLALSDAVATGISAPAGKAGQTLHARFGLRPGSKRRS
ncbi:MAG: hypothetical protein CML68_20290 [Rhodobacteraceae bacterium]|nr:hypothetical protein [Paracoccaceae bacterium]